MALNHSIIVEPNISVETMFLRKLDLTSQAKLKDVEPSILAHLSVISWKRFILELRVSTVTCEHAFCVVLATLASNSP